MAKRWSELGSTEKRRSLAGVQRWSELGSTVKRRSLGRSVLVEELQFNEVLNAGTGRPTARKSKTGKLFGGTVVPMAEEPQASVAVEETFEDWLLTVDTTSSGPREDQLLVFGWFNDMGFTGRYPLHHAALIGDVNTIGRLVQENAGTDTDPVDVNARMKDWHDSLPLSWAASFGSTHAHPLKGFALDIVHTTHDTHDRFVVQVNLERLWHWSRLAPTLA